MDFSLEEEDRVFAIEVSTAIFLFNRGRGYVSGCTTAPSGMQYFCLLEVRAMVVAIQQPSAECTAIFTVCIV